MSEASMVLKRYNMVRSESQAAQSRFRAVSLVRTGRASQVFKGMFPVTGPPR